MSVESKDNQETKYTERRCIDGIIQEIFPEFILNYQYNEGS